MTARLDPAEILRQVTEARTRPLWTLPASWWDEDVAVNMRDWINRYSPPQGQP